ncbi:MAG: ATPase, partial [Anaerolineales bacterium]|nr:ATPase [Anaerolineales bacterium]
MVNFVLGVDGGGTRTRVAAVDTTGRVLGIGIGGVSNYDDVGVEVAQRSIGIAVQEAIAAAGVDLGDSQAVFLGMAGVTSEVDRAHIRDIALNLRLAPAHRIGVDHDCRAALAGGLEGRPGIVQIMGTGSSTYGRNAAGESWLAGGRGHLIADEGSGYWLGIQAMRAAVRTYDGRDPDTALLPALLARLEIGSIDDLLYRLYVRNMTRTEIAALGPLVMEVAQAGDRKAQTILEDGAREVAECVYAVARRLGMVAGVVEVCGVGGVLESSPEMRARFA